MSSVADDRDKVRARLDRRGAPAGQVKVGGVVYELVGEEERVDAGWEERNADTVRARWDLERDRRLADRRAERDQLTLGARLDRALVELELGLGTRARPIASARSSGDDANPGGRHPGHVSGPNVEQPLRWIRHHVAMIEEALDAELGLLDRASVGDRPGSTSTIEAARMSNTEFRDAYVFDNFQGERSDIVAEQAPYLGRGGECSARTIERARVREAERRGVVVRAVDGVVIGVVSHGERVLRRVRIN